MKRIVTLLVLVFSSISIWGQVSKDTEAWPKDAKEVPDSSSYVYKYRIDTIDEEPRFQGGDLTDFSKWVASKVEYVNSEKCVSGRVFLQFIVKSDGSVVVSKVLRSLDPEFDAEAIRVVSISPKWEHGKHKGEAVNVSIVLPVTFVLR